MTKEHTTTEKDWQDRVADGLNEQGFLFQQRVQKTIEDSFAKGEQKHTWKKMGVEYPVTATDGRQTRLDLVLENFGTGIHLAIECKRSHPSYKTWAFFNEESPSATVEQNTLFIENITIPTNPSQRLVEDRQYWIKRIKTDCKCFNYYIETKVNKDKKASSTETIEEALSQVMFGQTGLMKKLYEFKQKNYWAVIPTIVTTAQLYEVEFESTEISIESGSIEANKLKLQPKPYVAVNYHASDNLRLKKILDGFAG